ncbi:SMP-30/gluconolactonase/LRE family protein [Micromonospora sp. NBC_01796]|uniref:SMP-30/gluconolactonase/LRE family protein n=1 Tax=Micromonospora sp. NBC_01796 TaxID=2975987 RepID=UPI002DD92BD7|nr:SMP-30/gluconolactonase/LRE family protein [Micromonospora sp. NBC_01796]WSA85501.1 SMP-30/gluconolactonase/LRE family protein [Micromonospora sp. NBC_01796]
MRLTEPTPWSDDRFELGEGARWVDGRLVLVDLLAGRLLETTGDAPAPLRELRRLDAPLGAVAPIAGQPGGWLAATGTGIAALTGTDGYRQVADLESANPSPARMNDAVADPHGRFWAGSMAYDTTPGAGTLYRYAGSGAPVPVVTGLTIANGPAFDAAGTTMYLADTPRGEVDRFTVDPRTGDLSGREPFLRLAPAEGAPDGMTVDAAGHLWVALWGGYAVRRYRPDGTLDHELRLPTAQPTSVCLGGPTLTRLFITTAHHALTPRPPLDGALLAIDTQTPGLPTHPATPPR